MLVKLNMKSFSILLFIFIILIQVIYSIDGSVLRKPFLNSSSQFETSSIPLTPRQLAFNVNSGLGRGPGSIISTAASSGANTVEEVGLNMLRRGTLSVANALVNALSSIGTFIDMIQNYAQTGFFQFNNLSSSSQVLANRLLNVGSNAVTNALNPLRNEAASSSGLNQVPSSNQFIVSESAPITQQQFDAGRQSISSWPQSLMALLSATTSTPSPPRIIGQNTSVSPSQQQFGGRVGTSTFDRPAVSVPSTSTASSAGGTSDLNGIDSTNDVSGSGVSGSASGWGGPGNTLSWSSSGGAFGLGAPVASGGTFGWGVASAPVGTFSWGTPGASDGTFGWGAPGASGGTFGEGTPAVASTNLFGWSTPSTSGSSFSLGRPSGRWGGPPGVVGWGGLDATSGLGSQGGASTWGSMSGWDISDTFDMDIDGLTMYGVTNLNNGSTISTLSTLMETFFNPLEPLFNNTNTFTEQTNQQTESSLGFS